MELKQKYHIKEAWGGDHNSIILWEGDIELDDVVISAVVIAGDVIALDIPAVATDDVVLVSLNGIVADTEMKYYKSNTATIIVSV